MSLFLHVPDDEVRRDIADTEAEIRTLEQEVRALELFPPESTDYKMARFRAGGKRLAILERRQFVEKLTELLAARAARKAAT